ncbi:helix-turn-helix domain-containing protein [Salinimicrobium catena]|uniref:helix-turn-helix domain-containing protein n=1 Tax=Salinimicrobium catena TaxID=390640 RepID=UPI002FE4D184
MKFPDKNIIDNWLQENGDPAIEKMVEKNLAIVEKINFLLNERNLTRTEFAKKLGKSPSEVSKWLSGSHNLTLKSITKMEVALETDLINIEAQYKYVYLGSVKGDGLEEKINDYEETTIYQDAS